MEGMWNHLRGRDLNAIDEILSCDSLEDTNRLMVELNIVSKNATNPQPSKMKLVHSESKLLNVDSSGNGNNVFIGTIPKEEKTSTCCIKAEDTSNNDESKLKPSLNSLANKIMKPCATVEPVESETCKGMEADSLTDTQSPTVVRSTVISGEKDIISETNSCSVELNPVVSSQTNIPDSNSTEANDTHRQTAINSSVISGDNNNISGTKSSNNVDLSPIVSSVTNTTVSNQISDVNVSDEGKVSASDELNQLKADEIAPLMSVEGLVCNYEGILEFNNEVAETIEIGNTTDITLDALMDVDIQNNRLDQRAILNVIGVSNDMLNIPAESIIFPRKVQINKENSALGKQKSTYDGKNDVKDGSANDPTSTSPENQVLSSYLVSSDHCENYVPLGLNTYLYNDSMISHYLAEVNADEVSDDEERFPGKLGAFRDQTKDSKSDSEEFETPTPESHTDSISAAESSPVINAQLSSTQQINRFEEEIIPQSSHEVKESEINDNQEKHVAPNLDCPQLKKRVSVEVTSLDMDLVKDGKINSKGMFESSDSSLHSKTVTLDENYEVLVDNHFSLTLNSNVFNSTNLPPIPHPSFERRCQCTICTKKYICLVGKYQQLLFSITRMEEDVKLSKLEEVHAQQDLLLKSIQDSLNDYAESDNKTDNNDERKTTMDKFITETNKEGVQHPETIHQSLNNEMNYHKDKIDLEREDASELQTKSCLPPKKRKSFSLPLRPLTKSKKNDCGFSTVDKLRSNCENDNNNDRGNENLIKTDFLNINEMTENCNKAVSENGDKTFKTKIVAIDGSYCVIPQCKDSTLNTNVELSSYFNNDSTSSKENKTKSCCYRKRKEEKKLRREKRRLKRQKKEKLREMSSKSSS